MTDDRCHGQPEVRPVKVITLTQPYATLIALGVKTQETRGAPPAGSTCPPGVRPLPGCGLEPGERLLIHAAARVPSHPTDLVPRGGYQVRYDGPRVGYRLWGAPDDDAEVGSVVPLPLGAIVASCVFAGAVPMVTPRGLSNARVPHLSVSEGALVIYRPEANTPAGWTFQSVGDQRPYGDYRPGRWAWLLDDVKPTNERCEACWGGRYLCVHGPASDAYSDTVLLDAASGYMSAALWEQYARRIGITDGPRLAIPGDWPWHPDWWKPSEDPIRNLVKAGALIAAEIDRLQRAAARNESDHG